MASVMTPDAIAFRVQDTMRHVPCNATAFPISDSDMLRMSKI
jgi:hypothetical protein